MWGGCWGLTHTHRSGHLPATFCTVGCCLQAGIGCRTLRMRWHHAEAHRVAAGLQQGLGAAASCAIGVHQQDPQAAGEARPFGEAGAALDCHVEVVPLV